MEEFKKKYGPRGASMILRSIAEKIVTLSPAQLAELGLSRDIINEQAKIARELELGLAAQKRKF